MGKAVRKENVGPYEHWIVFAYGQSGEIWCIPELSEDSISEMLDHLAQQRKN